MKILITGANGYLGQGIVKSILGYYVKLVIISRNTKTGGLLMPTKRAARHWMSYLRFLMYEST